MEEVTRKKFANAVSMMSQKKMRWGERCDAAKDAMG
jgi:hypothetical protein